MSSAGTSGRTATGGGTGAGADRSARTGARRLVIVLAAAVVAVTDLTAKAWATNSLGDRSVELGPLELRLGFNTGVAFSLGAEAPSWLVVAVTATITAGVAVLAWRAAGRGTRAQRAGLGLLLGGAVANLADRAGDGRVTDYLHTGWWPTFNLADVAIVTGASLLVLASFGQQPDDPAVTSRTTSRTLIGRERTRQRRRQRRRQQLGGRSWPWR